MTDFKKLSTPDGRREYYKYDLATPATLVHHHPPFLDPRFNKELEDRYGFDKHGDPRLRISWAGTIRQPRFREWNDATHEYSGMKYPFMRLRQDIGYEYIDANNKKVFVTKIENLPEDTPFVLVPHWDDLGVMKFVIEMKFTSQEMAQTGWYPELDKDEAKEYCRKGGKRYRIDPNPNGEYIFIHYIETKDGEYKDIEQADLDSVHYMFHRAANETEQEFLDRRTAELEQIAKITKKEDDQKLTDLIADARIRAEKKLKGPRPLIFV